MSEDENQILRLLDLHEINVKRIAELEKKFDGFKQSHINTHGEILERLSEMEKKIERSYTCPFDCEKAIEELKESLKSTDEWCKMLQETMVINKEVLRESFLSILHYFNSEEGNEIEGIEKMTNFIQAQLKKLSRDGEKEPTEDMANITQIIEIYDNGHEHIFYPDTHVVVKKADLEQYKKGFKEIKKEVKFINEGVQEWFLETLSGLIQNVEKYLKEDADES